MSDTTITPEHTEDTPNERRALLRKLAIGGAGAAAGAVLLKTALRPPPAAPSTPRPPTLTIAPTIVDYNGPALAADKGQSVFSAGGYAPDANSPYPAGVAGYGDATVPNGLHGSTTAAAGFGVVAANLSAAAAAATDPVPTAQAVASPNGAHMLLLAGSKSGPAAGKHVAGEVYVDKDGTLWFTVPTATAGEVRFVKLAARTRPRPGAFHAINPQRVYDSRQPGYPAALQGVMAPNTSRVISVADGRNASGTVTLANAVPAGATAVQINLTADGTTGPNYLAVTAGNVTTSETSVLNWNGVGVQIANSITVPVDKDRQIRVYCGNQPGSTHAIVDVFGYYI